MTITNEHQGPTHGQDLNNGQIILTKNQVETEGHNKTVNIIGVPTKENWSEIVFDSLYKIIRYTPLILFFVTWQVVEAFFSAAKIYLPSPIYVVNTAIKLTMNGVLPNDILASMQRVVIGLAMASLIGYPLGFLMGISKQFLGFSQPIFNFFRPIPPIAWIPLGIVWFGLGNSEDEFIIFLAAFFPIVLNTMHGVRGIETHMLRAARTLGAKPISVAITVILPNALPSMFIGFRVGFGIAWMAVVAAELVSATSGLGFLINEGRLLFRNDYIVVGMVVIGGIGLVVDTIISSAQRKIMPWLEESE
ncbi:ABC transporter permease [Acidiphilium sp. AL]|uniref:ABC transporter permease n=1 Tax=Acidiphilium sp. AL TaxID=2871704 RepID=UPI0021CB0DD5|nr:ABC transporter permease [Acidiphilium sp. AL]MCU4161981.1 ABC transporter permease [Acidiphilium sp. AL]